MSSDTLEHLHKVDIGIDALRGFGERVGRQQNLLPEWTLGPGKERVHNWRDVLGLG